ncbi:histidine kinase [Seinonella peptonophila]|uniref:histidine kinase n=1 Tax=Seinonella peptonophila TaxID=112248 RepID=A0A1M4ZMP4_9BACL|nr:HAMP domain-containing sensor histidine kinase [Seinonella peptonophila]SHF19264.1 histidine kinase [Seinonella peptonophila]
MSIRLRLILSYLAMLVIPIILFIISMSLMVGIFMGGYQEFRKQMDWPNKNAHRVPINMEWKNETIIEVKTLATYMPQKFNDKHFLNQLEQRLQVQHLGIMILKDQRIQHISSSLKNAKLIKALKNQGNIMSGIIKLQKLNYSYQQIVTGNLHLFIVKDQNVFSRFVDNFFWYIPLSLLMALALTNGLLTYFVSRSIIRPLDTLKKATEEIIKGNLDFKIKPLRNDELGKLSQAFEEMRKRLKELIEIQQHYEENRKELVSNISHDLMTPLTAIKGYVEGIRDGVADSPEKLEKYLAIIEQKANDMNELIDELFLFSKLDLKRVPFNLEKLSLNLYLKRCVEELQYDYHGRSLEIVFQPFDESVFVNVDREKLKRVMMNIVGNSLKYMDKEMATIEIFTQLTEDWITICIRDNGPGISSEALPHIFDRFYRADSSRSATQGGSGLGLAIAKQLVEGHGGEIWAESGLKNGTQICLKLPRIQEV